MMDATILWKDRKRFLGMPLSFTRYRMTDDRLIVETGLFNLKIEEVLLYRVRDISLSLSMGQRIFGVGTITLQCSDQTSPTLPLRNIKKARLVKEIIHHQVEENKIARKMMLGEMTAGHVHDETCGHEYMD